MNQSHHYLQHRSFKFICFQNKAHHQKQLQNTKPAIKCRPSSPIQAGGGGERDKSSLRERSVRARMATRSSVTSLSQTPAFRLNNKHRNEVKRSIRRENLKLCRKLNEIMEERPSRVFMQYQNTKSPGQASPPQSYQISQNAFYNKFQRPTDEIYQQNVEIAKRLSAARAVVGDTAKWEEHYASHTRNCSLIRHYSQEHQGSPDPQLYIPRQLNNSRGLISSFVRENSLLQSNTNSGDKHAQRDKDQYNRYHHHHHRSGSSNTIDQQKLFSLTTNIVRTPRTTAGVSRQSATNSQLFEMKHVSISQATPKQRSRQRLLLTSAGSARKRGKTYYHNGDVLNQFAENCREIPKHLTGEQATANTLTDTTTLLTDDFSQSVCLVAANHSAIPLSPANVALTTNSVQEQFLYDQLQQRAAKAQSTQFAPPNSSIVSTHKQQVRRNHHLKNSSVGRSRHTTPLRSTFFSDFYLGAISNKLPLDDQQLDACIERLRASKNYVAYQEVPLPSAALLQQFTENSNSLDQSIIKIEEKYLEQSLQ